MIRLRFTFVIYHNIRYVNTLMLQIIRLSDCVRVSEAGDVDGCPKDCKAFLVETTEKTFVFAVEMVEIDDWMQKLCEIAFPVSKN